MKINRRQFNFRLTSALLGLSAIPQLHAQGSPNSSASPSGTARRPYFFKDPTFEIIFLTSLGRAYHSGGDVGKVLYLTRQVEDGNFESAFLAFKQAGDEARALAEESESDGHKESARQAYLWGSEFFRQRHLLRRRLERSDAIPADVGAALRLLAKGSFAF
jgi:hypothetical protein